MAVGYTVIIKGLFGEHARVLLTSAEAGAWKSRKFEVLIRGRFALFLFFKF